MKPVQIEFVKPRAWKFIWATAGVVALATAATTGVKAWQLRQQRMVLERQLVSLEAQQLQRLASTRAEQPVQDSPRAASETAARRLLQRDWNRLYDAIETPALAKVRLIQLSFDAVSGQAMLEYELESMELAAGITQALNASNGSLPVWKLERLENGAVPGGAGGGSKIRGVWRASGN